MEARDRDGKCLVCPSLESGFCWLLRLRAWHTSRPLSTNRTNESLVAMGLGEEEPLEDTEGPRELSSHWGSLSWALCRGRTEMKGQTWALLQDVSVIRTDQTQNRLRKEEEVFCHRYF